MEVKWIDHKGARILSVDYRGARTDEDLIGVLLREMEELQTRPGKTPVLANYGGVTMTRNFLDKLSDLGTGPRRDKVGKTALLGVSMIDKAIFSIYASFTHDRRLRAYKTETDARDWLAEADD